MKDILQLFSKPSTLTTSPHLLIWGMLQDKEGEVGREFFHKIQMIGQQLQSFPRLQESIILCKNPVASSLTKVYFKF